ncbi:MAG: hypothetical protein DRI57_13565 [Deltaproteobacteria bacterium]|nr:MAG: hypothetical protein DRI57_13565 [Deltaproteobacteria bacterium]
MPTYIDFYGICEIKTPKCVAMTGGHVTAVWITQDCVLVNVCKPCLDENIHQEGWRLEHEKVKQGFADIAVYSEDDDAPQIIVKIRNTEDASPEWVKKIYSEAVKDSVISKVPYFLLATPDIFYLWRQENTHRDQNFPEAFPIKTKQFLEPYLKAHSINRENTGISENSESQDPDSVIENFKNIVRKWLTDIATRQSVQKDLPEFLNKFYKTIADGFVRTDVFMHLEPYAVVEGEDASNKGMPLSANPYNPETEWNLYQSWMEGWETKNWILESLLAQKKQKMEAEYPQWNKKRDEWIGRVNNLFTLIYSWLKPLEDNDYLKISYKDISISEQSLGRYSVREMIITFFNNDKIELGPVGLNIIGARGRVDMKMGMRTIGIIGTDDDSGWMFSERESRLGKPKTWSFDEYNFKAILAEFAEEL